jgi:hypothetical protein
VQKLNEFNSKTIFNNNGPKSFLFYVYIENASIKEIAKVAKEKFAHHPLQENMFGSFYHDNMTEIIHFQYFFVDEGKKFKLYTFIWYSQNNCGKQQLNEINSYDKKTKTWKNSIFSIEKFENFHGCKLLFLVPNGHNEFLDQAYRKTGIRWTGFNYEVLNSISKALNFSLSLKVHQNSHSFKNNPIEMVIVSGCLPRLDTKKQVFTSHPYFDYVDYLIVPPGEEYSGYEKLSFPFDFFTWFMIAFVFIVAFLVILMLNFMDVKIRQLVYGENVHAPMLNVAAHFFGLGQLVVPGKNFARILVMIFILYCLIIRTAWQSKIFEFMNQEMRKPEVESIQEMIEKNFTFYTNTRFGIRDYLGLR